METWIEHNCDHGKFYTNDKDVDIKPFGEDKKSINIQSFGNDKRWADFEKRLIAGEINIVLVEDTDEYKAAIIAKEEIRLRRLATLNS